MVRVEPEPDGWEFDGYCAVATAAYLFLKGEELAGLGLPTPDEAVDWEAFGRAARAAGYRSYQAGGPGGHWWLEYTKDGSDVHIIDLNIGVEDINDDYPYERERPTDQCWGHVAVGRMRYGLRRWSEPVVPAR